METQMSKLLKFIQKANGHVTYNELCQKYTLDVNVINKLHKLGYIELCPVNEYAEPTPETKVYLSLDGRSYLLDCDYKTRQEFIRNFIVPVITGVITGVLTFATLKIIENLFF